MGENGAGKSTLVHIAYGMVRPDTGELEVHGRPASIVSPRDARRLGIGMVHQHFTSIPALTVAENVALAAGWKPRMSGMTAKIAEVCARVGLQLEPGAETGTLPVSALQRLEIVKALAGDARALLLDEPTAVLAPLEKADLLQVIRRFADNGGAAVLITHKLEEALSCADRITILRRGKVTFAGRNEALSAVYLAERMFGERPIAPPPRTPGTHGEPLIVAKGLSVADPLGYGRGLLDATLTVRAGEVVGVAAVEGNGQRELLRAVAGLLPPRSGGLRVIGPVAFVPQDRNTEGLIDEFTLTENVVLGFGAAGPWVRHGWLNWARAKEETVSLIGEHGIRAAGPQAPAASLSGGNQQKLILARALSSATGRLSSDDDGTPKPVRVVIAEDPTRGLDLRAAQAVYSRLRTAANQGAAVLVYASDLDDVLEWADRVVVVAGGHVREPALDATGEQIAALMLT